MEEINAKIINSRNFTAFVLIYLITGSLVSLYFVFEIENNLYVVISILFVTFFSLFIFKRSFQRRFTTNCKIVFTSEKFNIILFNRKSNNLENNYEFRYNLIESFKTIDLSDDSSSLTLKMKSGSSHSFRFLDQVKKEGESIVTNLAFKYFVNFNNSIKKGEKKIILTPNFFATKSGLFFIIFLSVLFVISLIVEIVFLNNNNFFVFIPGAVIYLGILLQRKKDLLQKKKI